MSPVHSKLSQGTRQSLQVKIPQNACCHIFISRWRWSTKLLTRAPDKHCCSDPAPMWLLKRHMLQTAQPSNTSVLSSCMLSTQKHTIMSVRTKKPTVNFVPQIQFHEACCGKRIHSLLHTICCPQDSHRVPCDTVNKKIVASSGLTAADCAYLPKCHNWQCQPFTQ